MFSCLTDAGEFSIARRGGAWYGEFDGEVFGPFETATEAAGFLAAGRAVRLDGSPLPARGLPGDLGGRRRGGRERTRNLPAGGGGALVPRSMHP